MFYELITPAPPKWKILSDVLQEIKEMRVLEHEISPTGITLRSVAFFSF